MLERLAEPQRVLFFELEEPIASRELRARLERGDDLADLVPAAVAEIVEREHLYNRPGGYTEVA